MDVFSMTNKNWWFRAIESEALGYDTRYNRFSGSEKTNGGKSTERLTVLLGNAMFTIEKLFSFSLELQHISYFSYVSSSQSLSVWVTQLYGQSPTLSVQSCLMVYIYSLATVSTLTQTYFIRTFSNCLSMFAHTRKIHWNSGHVTSQQCFAVSRNRRYFPTRSLL